MPIAKPFVEMSDKVVNNPQLTQRERQLAVLAVCSVFRARFMTYAHIRISKEVGLTANQVYDARIGKVPEGLTELEQMAYEFCKTMASAREVVPEDLYARYQAVLGDDKITGLIYCVGLWSFTSLLMHITDVPIPEGGKIEK